LGRRAKGQESSTGTCERKGTLKLFRSVARTVSSGFCCAKTFRGQPLRSFPAGAFSPPGRAAREGRGCRNVPALQAFSQGVILVDGMVGFCGSRDLPASATDSALVSRVVGSVLAGVPRRDVAVGCAVGGGGLVVSSALALGASSRIRVFAAFGPVSPPWPAARVHAPGASSSVSSVSGVAGALAAGASVSWWAGGGPSVPLAGRLASRSAALVSAVAASGAGRGLVGLVSSSCPAGLGPSSSPSECFSGYGSGSWASLALAAGLGLPVVVFPVGALASTGSAGVLPASWGSWISLGSSGSAWSGGFRLVPASPELFSS
jgi:hypothetical protein